MYVCVSTNSFFSAGERVGFVRYSTVDLNTSSYISLEVEIEIEMYRLMCLCVCVCVRARECAYVCRLCVSANPVPFAGG